MTLADQTLPVSALAVRHLILHTLNGLPLTTALKQQGFHDAAEAVTGLHVHLNEGEPLTLPAPWDDRSPRSGALCLTLTQHALTALRVLPVALLLDPTGRTLLTGAQRHLSAAQRQLETRQPMTTEEHNVPKIIKGRH